MHSNLLLLPVISEKSFHLAGKTNSYVFEVPINSNKVQITKAVQDAYKVRVTGIRTIRVKGKSKRTLVKRGTQQVKGKRKDFKKAYVSLAEGDKIGIFEEGSKDGN